MADKKENPEGEEPEGDAPTAKGKKKGIVLGGGIVGLIAAAYVVSLVAVPSRIEERAFGGPFVVELSAEPIQVNLAGDNGKRFLVMTLQAEYDAYEETYAANRVTDLLYQARLKDALIGVARQKTKADLDDTVGEEVFKAEVRDAVDPLLFPIHVGNPDSSTSGDEKSGLGPGDSAGRSTMRGGFHRHKLTIDGPRGTIQLDDGPVVEFRGDETNLELLDGQGRVLHVDVSNLEEGFSGEVPVGTFGRVRNVYFGKFLVQ